MLTRLFKRTPKPPKPNRNKSLRSATVDALVQFLGAIHHAPVSRAEITKKLKDTTPRAVATAARSLVKNVQQISEREELTTALAQGPVLVLWRDPELSREQYTVFYAKEDSMLFLLDPIWGKRRVPMDIFENNWQTTITKKPWALIRTN